MKYQGVRWLKCPPDRTGRDTQFEIAIILEYYKNGQMQELEQYLESTFRMLSKMINNLGADPH